MALAVTIQNGGLKVKVTGLDLSLLAKGQWRRLLMDMGETLQERIVMSFENERVGGSSQLGKNTKAWNKHKAAHGLSRNDEATIRFLPQRLYGRVFYAEFYEEKKVNRVSVLVVAKSWAVDALKPLKSKLVSATMKAKRTEGRKRKRDVDKRRRA